MGFLKLCCQFGVSHEVRWGAKGASRVVPGKIFLPAILIPACVSSSPAFLMNE